MLNDRRLFATAGRVRGRWPAGAGRDQVCGIDGDPAPLDVDGGLERLAEQSLIRIEDDAHGDVRFAMLETIREYALDKLEDRVRRGSCVIVTRTSSSRLLRGHGVGWHGQRRPGRRLDRLEERARQPARRVRPSGSHRRDGAGGGSGVRRLALLADARASDRGPRAPGCSCWRMPGWPVEPSPARLRALEAAGGLAYWAGDTASRSALLRGTPSSLARELGDRERAGQRPLQPVLRPPSRDGSTTGSSRWPRIARCSTRRSRSGRDWTMREGVAKALVGSRRARQRTPGDYARMPKSAATRALAIFERLGDRFWIAWGRFSSRRSAGCSNGRVADAADGRCRGASRVPREPRRVRAWCWCSTAISTMLLMAGRTGGRIRGWGGARRAVPRRHPHRDAVAEESRRRWPTRHDGSGAPAAAARGAPGATGGGGRGLRLAGELAAEGDRDRPSG